MQNRASSSHHTSTPSHPTRSHASLLRTNFSRTLFVSNISMFQGNQHHHAATSVQAGAVVTDHSSIAVSRQGSWYSWLPGFMRGAARRDVNPPVFTRPLQQPLVTKLFGRSTKAAASTSRAAVNISSDDHHNEGPTHLIVLVNGLFGSSSNWDVVCEQLKQHLDPQKTLLHPSAANSRFETYEGIDRCGSRLASEVREVAAQHQSLQRISIIAHSMGGLMARYAIGMLYNTSNKSVCGLEPVHFITLATPHFGCDAEGVAQVPFIGWTGEVPLLGPHLLKVLQDISAATAAIIFRDTGKQFFMLDGSSSSTEQQQQGSRAGSSNSTATLPVLLQMTQDCPDRGLFFYSALSSFKTRTCYANTDGDHLVGYANSSIRSLQELPPLPAAAMTAKGVVMEDPLTAAFFPEQWQKLQQVWQQQQSSVRKDGAPAAAEGTATGDGLLRQSYQPSRHWLPTQTAKGKEGAAAAAAAAGSSTGWHELDPASRDSSGGSSRKRRAIDDSSNQQQQEDVRTVAALELAAAGAAAAATEAVADLLSLSGQQQQELSATRVDRGSSSRREQSLSFRADTSVNTNSLRRSMSSSSISSGGSDTSAAAAAAAEQDLASGLSGAGTTAAAGNQQTAVDSVAADAAALAASNASRAEMVAHMLHRLQELPWRRVDVSFRGARFGFAHNNIQVTRRWWNFEGEQVPRHLAQQMQVMDAVLMTKNGVNAADGGGESRDARLHTEGRQAETNEMRQDNKSIAAAVVNSNVV